MKRVLLLCFSFLCCLTIASAQNDDCNTPQNVPFPATDGAMTSAAAETTTVGAAGEFTLSSPNVCGLGTTNIVYFEINPTADANLLIEVMSAGGGTDISGEVIVYVFPTCPSGDNPANMGQSCSDLTGGGTTSANVCIPNDGNPYLIAVGSTAAGAGDFSLNLTNNNTGNETCPGAEAQPNPLTCDVPISIVVNVTNACPDNVNGCSPSGNGLWYSFTTDALVKTFTITGATVSLYEGADCTSMLNVGCETAITNFTADPFTTYWLLVSSSGTVDITSDDTTPTNDLCANADVMSSGTTITGSTVCASADLGDPTCGDDENSVWYTYTVAAGELGFEVTVGAGSTGTSIAGNASVMVIDDCASTTLVTPFNGLASCGSLPMGPLQFICLDPGDYFIQVASTNANAGTFDITTNAITTGTPADNDDCATEATPIVGASPLIGESNLCATGDIDFGCTASTNENSVWYEYTVPAGVQSITIDVTNFVTFGGAAPAEIALAGLQDDCATLYNNVPIECLGGAGGSLIIACPVEGDIIKIGVSTSDLGAGTFDIMISETLGAIPTNDDCANLIDMTTTTALSMQSNICATADVVPNCDAGSLGTNSVWFSYTFGPTVKSIDLNITNWSTLSPAGGAPSSIYVFAADDGCGNMYFDGDLTYEHCGAPGTELITISCQPDGTVVDFFVASSADDQGTFDIEIVETNYPTNPACGWNDVCDMADDLTGSIDNSMYCMYQPFSGCNELACPDPVAEVGSLGCDYDMNATVWHSVTIPIEVPPITSIDVQVEGTGFNPSFSVIDGGACGGPYTTLVSDDGTPTGCINGGSNPEITSIPVTEGQTYLIPVSAFDGSDGGNFTININFKSPPVNDECANPIDTNTDGLSQDGTTLCADQELVIGTCAPNDLNQVWYTYTAPTDLASITIKVSASGANPATGTFAMDIGTLVSCTGTAATIQSVLPTAACATDILEQKICLVEGETYYIAVSTEDTEAGDFNLLITEVFESGCTTNDDCEDADLAEFIPDAAFYCEFQSVPGCSTEACPDPDVFTGCGGDMMPTVWHSVTVPADAVQMIVQVSGAMADPLLGVFTGACGALAPADGNDCVQNGDPTTEIAVLPGEQYIIAVGTATAMNGGDYNLEIQFVVPPENDNPCPTAAINPPFELSGGSPTFVTTTCCAIGSEDDPALDFAGMSGCAASLDENTVWFTYTPPNYDVDGWILEGSGSSGGPFSLEYYIGTANSGCDGSFTYEDGECSMPAEFTFSCLEPGDVVYIRVSSSDAGCGEYSVSVKEYSPECENADECDDISAAQQVGELVTDPNFEDIFPQCVTSCLELACPETIVSDCETANAPTVWFEVTTDAIAAQLYTSVTTSGGWTPNWAIYQSPTGSCADLALVPGGTIDMPANCGEDDDIHQVGIQESGGAPVQTYYVAVSGVGDLSVDPTFEFCAYTSIFVVACLGPEVGCDPADGFSAEVTERENDGPLEGPYCQGEVLEVCVDFFYDASETGVDWLIGIVPNFGSGWDMTEFDPEDVTVTPGGVAWYEEGTALAPLIQENVPHLCTFVNANGVLEVCNWLCETCPCAAGMDALDPLPSGWFWVTAGGLGGCDNDGSPGEGYGIGSVTAQIDFCMNLTVATFDNEAECIANNDLSLGIQTFSDGVAGCWEDPVGECLIDKKQTVSLGEIACQTPPELETDPDISSANPYIICNNGTTDITILTSDGTNAEIYVTVMDNPNVNGENLGGYFFTGSGSIMETLSLVSGTTTPQTVTYTAFSGLPGNPCPGPEIMFDVIINPEIEVEGEFFVCQGLDEPNPVLFASATYGTGVYVSYQWSPLNGAPAGFSTGADGNNYQINQSIPPSPIGSPYQYSVTVTDNNTPTACTGVGVVELTVYPEVEVLFDPVVECVKNVGDPDQFYIVTPNPVGGLAPYSYTYIEQGPLFGISLGDLYEIDLANSGAGGLPVGLDVLIVDANGCTFDTEVEITLSQPVDIQFDVVAECDSLFATINAQAFSLTPGVPILGMVIEDAAGNQVATASGSMISAVVDAEGTYTIIATDQLELCPAEVEVPVSFLSIETPTITGDSEICIGETATFAVSNTTDYTMYGWDDPSFSTTASISVTPTVTTTYNVQLENADGCATTAPWTVTVNPLPAIAQGEQIEFCDGNPTDINAGGDPATSTYMWDDVASSTTQIITITTAGTYSVTVTDNVTMCTSTTSFETVAGSVQTIQLDDVDLCDNNPEDLVAAAGADSYTWTYDIGAGEVPVPGAGNTNVLTVTEAGTYFVTGTIGQCVGEGQAVVTLATTPPLAVTMTINVCDQETGNGATDINFEDQLMPAGASGSWANTDGALVSLADLSSVDFTGVTQGVYNFTFTTDDAVPPCVNPSAIMQVTVIDCGCPNATTTAPLPLCSTGGFTILGNLETINTDDGTWALVSAPMGATVDIADGTFESMDQPAGDYVFEFTVDMPGQGSCVNSSQQTVVVIDPPAATVDMTAQACSAMSPIGVTNLDFTTLVSGDPGDWTLTNSPGGIAVDLADLANVDFNGLTEGDYTFTYTTNTAVLPCTDPSYTLVVSVVNCDCPIFGTEPTGDLCNDSGMIDLSTLVTPGSEAGTWSITDGPAGNTVALNGSIFDATSAEPGTYTVTYTLDVIPPGCPSTSAETIEVIGAPVLTLPTDTTICSDVDGDGPTILDLTALISAGETNGTWVDVSGCGLDLSDPSAVSFVGVADGTCTLEYTTPANPTCPSVSAMIDVAVSDCLCPNVSTIATDPLCNTGNLAFDLSQLETSLTADGSWNYEPGSGPQEITITDDFFDPSGLQAGTYIVYFQLDTPPTDATCPDTTQQAIQVLEPMNPGTPDAPARVCFDEVTTINLADLLTGEDAGGMWIETTLDGSTGTAFDPTAGTFSTAGQLAGTYTFLYGITDGGPCADVDATVEVVIESLPIADAGVDRLLDCVTLTVDLGGASSTGTTITYSWTEASGKTVANADQMMTTAIESGTYVLLVTDESTGCTATDEMVVDLSDDQPQLSVVADDPDCFGVNNGTITVTPLGGGDGNYEYSLDGGTTWQTGLIFNNLAGGDYVVTMRDGVGCQNSASTSLTAPMQLTLDVSVTSGLLQLGEDGELIIDTNIDPSQIGSFVISENENVLNIPFAEMIVITPQNQTNIYTVTITDLNGCVVSDQVTVQTTRVIDIYVPNIFSPNSDGTNDNFNVQTNEDLTVLDMKIYDRWGELIYNGKNFRNNDLTSGWDGLFKGEPVELGVYVYVIKVQFDLDGSEETLEGDITIMR